MTLVYLFSFSTPHTCVKYHTVKWPAGLSAFEIVCNCTKLRRLVLSGRFAQDIEKMESALTLLIQFLQLHFRYITKYLKDKIMTLLSVET